MSSRWHDRKHRLLSLLECGRHEDEEEGRVLDRLLHGQAVIGKTRACFTSLMSAQAKKIGQMFREDD